MNKEQQLQAMEELFPRAGTLHCQCLYEIENNLPRTKYCFMACHDQHMILHERYLKEKENGNITDEKNEQASKKKA